MRRAIAYKILIQFKLIGNLDQILHVFAYRMHSEPRNPEPDPNCLMLYPDVHEVNPAYQHLHVFAFNSHLATRSVLSEI
jgi:hypothetical protein